MSKKQVIAVDIDDVLSPQTEHLLDFSNTRYGTNLTLDDIKKPGDYWGYYEKILNEGPVESNRRFQEFLDERMPLTQDILTHTKKVISRLASNYNLEIVTSRKLDYHKGTVEWLENHTPGIFKNVHIVELWDEPDTKATKAKVCQEIGAGYLIDDNIEHCNLASEVGIHALLFGEYGWNINKPLHKSVHRVLNWEEVSK